jgi:hypothetical protein
MAFTIEATDVATGQKIDFWNVHNDVYPNGTRVSTDVMLIQAFLVAYFMNPSTVPSHLRARASAIITRSSKRFDDGIYGPNTRAVMSLFEEDMRAPFRDGIVRKAPMNFVAGPETKLKRLNFMWNMTMLSDTLGATKKETGRKALQPALFRELYPDG